MRLANRLTQVEFSSPTETHGDPKNAGPLLRREVDVTDRPVIEEQAQSIVTDHGYADNSRQIRHHLHLMGEARWEPAVRIAGLAPNWPTAHPCAGLPILERSPEPG